MTAEYIAKGMEFIQTANQKEDEEQFEAAISLYNEGIQQLVTALEYSQKDENMATNLKKQVEQYLKRVEAIKAFVKEAEEQKEEAAPAANGDGDGDGDGAGDDDLDETKEDE